MSQAANEVPKQSPKDASSSVVVQQQAMLRALPEFV